MLIDRPGFLVASDQLIEIHGEELPYVSRGGLKLAAALDFWKIDLSGRNCLDIGISTGGFTDCMLQRGAGHVIGIDSGHGQLAQRLKDDARLLLMESTNARHLTASMLPHGIGFFAMDISFIAASLVLPAVIASAFPSPAVAPQEPRDAIILVKPQFEAGREFVGKNGLVRSEAGHRRALDRVRQTLSTHRARSIEQMDSPIAGGEGNREFLLYARF